MSDKADIRTTVAKWLAALESGPESTSVPNLFSKTSAPAIDFSPASKNGSASARAPNPQTKREILPTQSLKPLQGARKSPEEVADRVCHILDETYRLEQQRPLSSLPECDLETLNKEMAEVNSLVPEAMSFEERDPDSLIDAMFIIDIKKSLRDRVARLQAIIDKVTHAKVRKVNILDLPDNVLSRIFDHVTRDVKCDKLAFYAEELAHNFKGFQEYQRALTQVSLKMLEQRLAQLEARSEPEGLRQTTQGLLDQLTVDSNEMEAAYWGSRRARGPCHDFMVSAHAEYKRRFLEQKE
ncbi:hypothetical protein CORC01_07609 [Colletotrichum orchidophilum]|uniref:Uncharacterized protein n=1 Tax=Colletotrichum orchidophilum TaxID=1209926 RepID=A0A1G4B6U0_9PEZI|nr:uncharacterized protein CORC01_07609 [Colletotrichum orchidophilum]OHE97168.1 hypothetical protein CORC01_07609 [Colletotrichum orchidophilum]